MKKSVIRKIRRSVKRELDRHDWCSSRIKSGKYLRRASARLILNDLSTKNNIKKIENACRQWDYIKKNIWNESVDWRIFYFVIDYMYYPEAKYEIVAMASQRATQEIMEIEDARIFRETG